MESNSDLTEEENIASKRVWGGHISINYILHMDKSI